jgi:AcrR family transcriptional regulator
VPPRPAPSAAPPTPPEAAGTSAWRLLPQDKRSQIFAAAAAEFADKGYSGASMNQLVRLAGISKGSLFHYFGSKGALFDALVEAAFGQVRQLLREVRDGSRGQPLPERLEALLEAGFSFIEAHPRLAQIYFRLLRSGDAPLGARRLADLGRRSRGFLQELIEESQAAGETDPALDAARTAWLLDAMLERLLGAWHSEHLARGTALHQAGAREREAWIAAFRRLVETGLNLPGRGA